MPTASVSKYNFDTKFNFLFLKSKLDAGISGGDKIPESSKGACSWRCTQGSPMI